MRAPAETSGESDHLTAETQRFWAGRTGEAISPEDAREAVRNVAGLFDLLARWDAGTVSDAASEPEDRGLET